MPRILSRLEKLLLRDEGLSLKPYRDSVGKLTIGIGRNLDDVGISEEEALVFLDHDIHKVTVQVADNLPWYTTLDPCRQAVLLSMAFNMGIGGLLGFKNTLEMIRLGKYTEAAEAMLKSKWATQVKGRAIRLAKMMETGDWQ